jgi:YebC/PmpR family DNA-binding regulatory protein
LTTSIGSAYFTGNWFALPVGLCFGKAISRSYTQLGRVLAIDWFILPFHSSVIPCMAGHNKWSKIKRIKGVLDARRGKIFSKLAKEITVAAKLGGGDASMNPRLRSAVLAAKAQNMPNDNIDRAVKKGTGELEGEQYEELVYEGYAPGGVAVLIEVATDNKNRTAADLRLIFTKNAGNLASNGSVAYMFRRKGQITVPVEIASEEKVIETVLEFGAEDVVSDGEHHTITTPPDQLFAVGEALREAGIEPDSQKLTYIPENSIAVTDSKTASQIVRLCDALEDCDDVQSVHANFDFTEDVIAQISE